MSTARQTPWRRGFRLYRENVYQEALFKCLTTILRSISMVELREYMVGFARIVQRD